MSCCPLATQMMEQLGATHAAKMHKLGKSYKWSLQDVELHFAEEDKFFFPVVIRDMPEEAVNVARLRREHKLMLAEARMFGRVSDALWDRHAKEEDRLAVKLYRKWERDKR